MKCKSHPYEQGVGVCASCLRERLLALIATQNELSANHHHHHYRRRSDRPPPPPPPLVFPRSVSPYVSRRRSVGSDASPVHPRHHLFQRFFSTPQVGPTFGSAAGLTEIDGGRRRRFSVLRTLFRHHRSEEAEPCSEAPRASAPGSWFSALIRGRRKKKKAHAEEEEEEAPPSPRSRRALERGMSPSMEDEGEGDGGGGGYSSDERWRPTPTPKRPFPFNHRHHSSVGSVSGFSVCLSPLMRFGPDSRRSQAAPARISSIAGAWPTPPITGTRRSESLR